jgi:endonuclease YncB( thermonuclease family)
MTPTSSSLPPPAAPGLKARLQGYLPDLLAFAGALLSAGLAAFLLAVLTLLPGCGGGGGVGGEGTGSFASVTFSSGTITGFGSIVVNGVHYDEAAATVQDDDGASLDRSSLALGMVVQVSAGGISTATDGTLVATASAVRASRSLLGPVSAINLATGRLTVLGQGVAISAATVVDSRWAGGLASVAIGQVVEVYGYFDASRSLYVATRLAPASAGSGYRISGPVASVDDGQTFHLGGQTFSGATSGLSTGSLVRLNLQTAPDTSGRWVVSAQRAEDKTPSDREGARLDGLVSAVSSTTRFVVDGTTVDSSLAQVSGTVQVGAKVEVRGLLRAGVLLATEVQVKAAEAASQFELKGSASALDTSTRRFVLRGVTVSYARSDVVFKNGSAAQLVGYTGTLKVEGLLSADRTVLEATKVEFSN